MLSREIATRLQLRLQSYSLLYFYLAIGIGLVPLPLIAKNNMQLRLNQLIISQLNHPL